MIQYKCSINYYINCNNPLPYDNHSIWIMTSYWIHLNTTSLYFTDGQRLSHTELTNVAPSMSSYNTRKYSNISSGSPSAISMLPPSGSMVGPVAGVYGTAPNSAPNLTPPPSALVPPPSVLVPPQPSYGYSQLAVNSSGQRYNSDGYENEAAHVQTIQHSGMTSREQHPLTPPECQSKYEQSTVHQLTPTSSSSSQLQRWRRKERLGEGW